MAQYDQMKQQVSQMQSQMQSQQNLEAEIGNLINLGLLQQSADGSFRTPSNFQEHQNLLNQRAQDE